MSISTGAAGRTARSSDASGPSWRLHALSILITGIQLIKRLARSATLLLVVVLTACGSTPVSSTSPMASASPSAAQSPSIAPSPSPTATASALPAGWIWYSDPEHGYSVAIAAAWVRSADSTGTACPYFSTDPSAPTARQFRPTDEAFGLCSTPASGCTTPHNNGFYTPITVAGVNTYESLSTGDGSDWPNGFREYDVDLPGNGICYELHAQFMGEVPDARVTLVRQTLWTSFTLFTPESVASSAR